MILIKIMLLISFSFLESWNNISTFETQLNKWYIHLMDGHMGHTLCHGHRNFSPTPQPNPT